MVKQKELSLEQRSAITTLRNEGNSHKVIAVKLSVSKSAVSKTISRFNKENSHKSLPRSGRPRCTTQRIDREITKLIRNSNRPNAVKVAEELSRSNLCNITPATVRNRLNESNFHS